MQVQALIALLLPLAAASGWYTARRHYQRKFLEDHVHPLTQAYRRGLNYLLDDKTDKAIAAVGQILEQDDESLEVQIAFGNLFRRRGEVERAIEIHTRLRATVGLTESQRARADFELALDYLRAGLYDRSESLFLSLVDTKTHGKPALQQLLLIYQQQKEWQKAIDCIIPLRRVMKPKHGETAAHFYCELAEEAMNFHRLKDARDYLAQALKDDAHSVRATIAKGRLELGNGEYRQAFESFQSLEGQNPIYLSVVLPHIRLCSERLGLERDLMDYLDSLYQSYGLVSAAVECAIRLRQRDGIAAAIDYLIPILEKTPDSLAISHALSMLSEDHHHGSQKMRRLSALLKDMMEGGQQFCCEHCGFGSSQIYWRCPSCQYWGSVRPTGPFSALDVQEDDAQKSR